MPRLYVVSRCTVGYETKLANKVKLKNQTTTVFMVVARVPRFSIPEDSIMGTMSRAVEDAVRLQASNSNNVTKMQKQAKAKVKSKQQPKTNK